MDLSKDEAERLFPDDREIAPDDADVEPYVSIDRRPYGWSVTVRDVPWRVSEESVSSILDDLDDELDVSVSSIWALLVDCETTVDVLDRNT